MGYRSLYKILKGRNLNFWETLKDMFFCLTVRKKKEKEHQSKFIKLNSILSKFLQSNNPYHHQFNCTSHTIKVLYHIHLYRLI